MKWLCWLFGHKMAFAYRQYSHDGPEFREVKVVCVRCGYVSETFGANIDSAGNMHW